MPERTTRQGQRRLPHGELASESGQLVYRGTVKKTIEHASQCKAY
jgi:hypothetical protein